MGSSAPNFKYKPYYDIMEYDRTPPSLYNGPHKRLRGAFGGYGTPFYPRGDRDTCSNDPYSCLEGSLSAIPYKKYCPCDSGKSSTDYSSSSNDFSSSNSSDFSYGNKISTPFNENYNKKNNPSYSSQSAGGRVPIQIKNQTEVQRDPITEDIKIKHVSSRIRRKD